MSCQSKVRVSGNGCGCTNQPSCRSMVDHSASCEGVRQSPYRVRVCGSDDPKAKDVVDLLIQDIGPIDGQVVVFIPGAWVPGSVWDYQLDFLADLGYRVISVDPRGHGGSSAPLAPYNYDAFADDLAALFDKLNLQNIILVGISRGGGIALHYTARYKCCRLKKLLLVAAAAPTYFQSPSNPFGPTIAQMEATKVNLRHDKPATMAFFASMYFYTAVSAEQRQAFQNLQVSTPVWAAVGDVSALEEDLTPDLAKVCVPTGIFYGAHDQIVTPQSIQAQRDGIPNNTYTEFANAGHVIFIDQPDAFNAALLDFVST